MAVQAFDLAERLQTPVFVLSRPRHRHERLDVPRAQVGRQLSARPRQGAEQGGDRGAAEVPPLPRQGRRRHPVPDAARRDAERRVLHARLGPQPVRRLHRGLDRVPGGARPAAAQVQACAHAGAGRRSSRRPAPATIGLVSVGSSRGAVTEARDILAKRGIPIDYMRIKAFPFTKEVEAFMASHEKIFVVEQNRDAQLRSLLTLETDVPNRSCTRSCTTAAADDLEGDRGVGAASSGDDQRAVLARSAGRRHSSTSQGPPSRPADQRARLTRRDYEGAMSTLCAGCGHDSVTAAIIEAFWGLDSARSSW